VTIETQDAASFYVTGEPTFSRQLFYTEYGVPSFREPTQELVWFTCDQVQDGWNWQHWCDEQYSSLFEQSQTELDRDKRHDIYVQMQQIWDAAANTVWVTHPAAFVASRNDKVTVLVDPAGTVYWTGLAPV
jgi:ABC-type transport system substrate-binding protein